MKLVSIGSMAFTAVLTLGAFAVQAEPEADLSALLRVAVASKQFTDYKLARGFGMSPTAAAVRSLEIQKLSPTDSVNQPRVKGAPIYEFQIVAKYTLKQGGVCVLKLPFLKESGVFKYGNGSSEGCGE